MEDEIELLEDDDLIDWREEVWIDWRWDYRAEELRTDPIYGTLL